MTGERELALISEAEELQIGKQAAAEVQATIGLVEDARLQAYVQEVGRTLARDSHRPNLPWSFAVVEDPTPNAFALPGGYIFVTRGMMNLMNSEAELASVLGHEIGHVAARHSVSQISRQQLAQLGLGLGTIFFPSTRPFGDLIGTGVGLLFLKYGRDDERQADELGFQYSLKNGYAVTEMVDVFTALSRMGDEQRSALPSWLSTHPAPEERIKLVQTWIDELPAEGRGTRIAEADYLGRIDGLVYGSNPRNGFFRQGVFYHPELRFQFDVPPEWQAQNLTDAVISISPDQDAAIQLTLAQGSDPSRAAQAFVGQGNLQRLASSRETFNGVPAVVTAFDALTDGGVVRGLVAHIGYRGRVYQLLGYTPRPRFSAYEPLFERVISSFAPVTERSVLDVQPQRIDIVRLKETMTLEEFSRRYESAVPVAELALINGLSGPEASLRAGSLVKRVT